MIERYNELTDEDRTNSWFGHAVSRFGLEKGRDTATFIQDDDLHAKLKRLVENAELEWREPTPDDAEASEDDEPDIDDPRYTVKEHVRTAYTTGEEFTKSEVAGALMDTGLSPEQVGNALYWLVQQEELMRDDVDYWRLK